MLAALGDLVEDIAVDVASPINVASDTDARITRRRGGSAANVAASAAAIAGSARFLGQVGDDRAGAMLIDDLAGGGVDVQHVRRAGRSATIAVLVDPSGERTMLVDRGSTRDLTDPDERWLDGVSVLHVPFYSLAVDPIATTAGTLIEWCHRRRIPVSIDVSSASVVSAFGVDAARALIASLRPSALFANQAEADLLGIAGLFAGAVTFVKRGARAATVFATDGTSFVEPAIGISAVVDTTAAGDAFAAGALTSPDWQDDPGRACRAGHRSAHALLIGRLGA